MRALANLPDLIYLCIRETGANQQNETPRATRKFIQFNPPNIRVRVESEEVVSYALVIVHKQHTDVLIRIIRMCHRNSVVVRPLRVGVFSQLGPAKVFVFRVCRASSIHKHARIAASLQMELDEDVTQYNHTYSYDYYVSSVFRRLVVVTVVPPT